MAASQPAAGGAVDRFKAEYAAAIERLQGGSNEDPGAPRASVETEASEEPEEEARSKGLGFGAARPDSSRVREVRLATPRALSHS